MAKETQWIDILIIEDNVKGAILGIYSVEFEKNKTYRVNKSLADTLIKMGVAVIQGTPGVEPLCLHVNELKGTKTMAKKTSG